MTCFSRHTVRQYRHGYTLRIYTLKLYVLNCSNTLISQSHDTNYCVVGTLLFCPHQDSASSAFHLSNSPAVRSMTACSAAACHVFARWPFLRSSWNLATSVRKQSFASVKADGRVSSVSPVLILVSKAWFAGSGGSMEIRVLCCSALRLVQAGPSRSMCCLV